MCFFLKIQSYIGFLTIMLMANGLDLIPEFNSDDVILQLFTRNDPINGTELVYDEKDILNVSKPTVFLVHGWITDMNTLWVENLTSVYLEKGDINVIKVDWSFYANNINYPWVRYRVTQIGDYLGNFIVNASLNNTNGFLTRVHIVGHSLGAHIGGYAGQTVKKVVKRKIWRITGLDAASPLFVHTDKNQRLSKEDATFVDVIHTCGGSLGILNRYAQIDYYPNGGIPPQPNCLLLSCSHSFSHDLFIAAVNTDFIAVACSSYDDFLNGLCVGNKTIILGKVYHVPHGEYFKYYLTTQ